MEYGRQGQDHLDVDVLSEYLLNVIGMQGLIQMDHRCPQCFKSLRFKSLAQGEWLAGINAAPYICPFCGTGIVYTRSPVPEIFRGRTGARLYKLIIALSVASALAIGINTKQWVTYAVFGTGFGLSVIMSIEAFMVFVFRRVARYTIALPFMMPAAEEQPMKYLRPPTDITDLKSGDIFTVIKPFSDARNCVVSIGDKLTYQRQAFDSSGMWTNVFAERILRLNEDQDEHILHNVDEYLKIIQLAPRTVDNKASSIRDETPMRRNAVYLMIFGLLLSTFSFTIPHTLLNTGIFMGVTTMSTGIFFYIYDAAFFGSKRIGGEFMARIAGDSALRHLIVTLSLGAVIYFFWH